MISSHEIHLEIAEKLKEKNKNMKINENILSGIFEITLYQNFIYQNLKKYNYHFVDMSQKIKKSLPKNDYNLYEKNFYDKCNGSCGLTEHTCLLLTNSNYKGLAGLFKELNLNIIRCDYTDINNYRYQKKFLDIVKPNILASSQNHWFGLNNKPFNRLKLIIQNDKNYKKLIKHGRYFYQPLKSFFDWLSQPVAVIFYFIKLLLNMIKNIKSFL